MTKRSLQFELFEECNNNCKFCYLGTENRHTPTHLKLDAIKKAYAFISNPDNIKDYDVISYIGGEFFQGQLNTQEIKDAFYELIRFTGELHATGKISEIWLMTTMTIGDQHELFECVDLVEKEYAKVNKPELMKDFWISTSYDTIGRFHTEKMLHTWENTALKLHEKYPLISMNTCSILTQDFITKYLNNELSLTDFQEKFKTGFFFKQPSPGSMDKYIENISDPMERHRVGKQMQEKLLPGFFPKREDFMMFLIKLKNENPELYIKLFNIQFRADDLYRNYNTENENERMQYNHREKNTKAESTDIEHMPLNTCGHQINYCCYIDSDACVLCDKQAIGD